MRKIVPVLGGLIMLLTFGMSSSAHAATSSPACATNARPLFDYHTGNVSWISNNELTFIPAATNPVQSFCLQNLGGGEFEIMDPSNGGCLSINSITRDVTEESAAGCAINGGHGYLWNRWYALSTDTAGGGIIQLANMYYTDGLPEYTSGVGCMYGDTTPAQYVVPCNTSKVADKAEWFEWPAY